MVGRIPHPVGWEDRIIAVLEMITKICKVIDQVKAGDSSEDKLAGAVEMLQAREPQTVQTLELIEAREAVISAQVRYANALSAAAVTHGA